MRFSHNARPKRLFAQLLFSVSLIATTCVSSFAQDWHTVHDGMEYAEVTRTIDNQPVRMNLLRLDLKKVRLDVVHAMDAAIGTETVSSIATRHNAVAAINAGFFRLDNSIWAGDPAGLFFAEHRLLSESNNGRIALVIRGDDIDQAIDFRFLNLNAEIQTASSTKAAHSMVSISGINRERKPDEVILYTPEFHRRTLTANAGVEIIVEQNRVISVSSGTGNNLIPQRGFVISASGTKQKEVFDVLKVGNRVDVVYSEMRSGSATAKVNGNGRIVPVTSEAEYIVAGVPQLIKDGKIDITWQEEKTTKSFVETRHPRTAVAKLKDGKFLMITVDGRSESSGGISLYDLAAYLLELGATDAMNLDGGGSTTMFLDGKVVNHPSDKEGERKVSDAILVTLRKKN